MRCLKTWWVGCLWAWVVCGVWAQSYPSQPIKLIQPFAPGAASEVALRIVAERLGMALKTAVLIENRPGAGSTLGADSVAKATPDGYTLVASYNSSIAPGPLMYSKIPYDPIKDFQHIALIGVYPQYLIVRTDHPAKSIQDFIQIVRNKPGTVNYASAGVGTSGFLVAELLKQTLSLQMTHIPYKGPAQAITDLLGGRLDMVLTASATELVKAGKVRVLAVTSEKRIPMYPDIPALEEIAPGVQAVSWVGISAPAQTPKAITMRLEKEILAVLNAPDMQARLSEPALGLFPLTLGSDKFLDFIQKEMRTWAPVIKAGNIRVD
ncbi:MAG: tripartite tricarboxylate transporter substrate binding protein [Betaproteobacteria bacterium]|nr:tripartite tricarboxylate transporter substrate binding protein [Betaproteobacteria bacterium]NBY06300.1 tripartite tricarboxylate transporter substrate binding protein [Betaproteobacteria bacterium]